MEKGWYHLGMTNDVDTRYDYHRNGISGQGFFTALTDTALTIEWNITTPDDCVGLPTCTWDARGVTHVDFTDAAHRVPLAVLARLDAARTGTLPTIESGYPRQPDFHQVLTVADGPFGIAIFDATCDGLDRVMVAFTDLTDPDDDLHRTAVFDLTLLQQGPDDRFGHNSWRGDLFHFTALRAHNQAMAA
jgi:hypothetical protein